MRPRAQAQALQDIIFSEPHEPDRTIPIRCMSVARGLNWFEYARLAETRLHVPIPVVWQRQEKCGLGLGRAPFLSSPCNELSFRCNSVAYRCTRPLHLVTVASDSAHRQCGGPPVWQQRDLPVGSIHRQSGGHSFDRDCYPQCKL